MHMQQYGQHVVDRQLWLGRLHLGRTHIPVATGVLALSAGSTGRNSPATSSSRTSHRSNVERRCAIMNVVRPSIKRLTASIITASIRVSTELVGSSKMRIGASLKNARASAIL